MDTNIDTIGIAITENKITAAEVETNCPVLTNYGTLIADCIRQADECDARAEEFRIRAGELIAEAYKIYGADGFDALRKKFFPHVGRSRAYELMAVATGKRSANEIRKSNRERNARYRAKKATDSVTVTDSPKSDTENKPVTPIKSEPGASSSKDEIATLKAKVATLEAEIATLKAETLLQHWKRCPEECKTVIDYATELAAKINPFRQMCTLTPDEATAKTEEALGTHKTRLFLDSLQARMTPKGKAKQAKTAKPSSRNWR